jgi:hypothetical protein
MWGGGGGAGSLNSIDSADSAGRPQVGWLQRGERERAELFVRKLLLGRMHSAPRGGGGRSPALLLPDHGAELALLQRQLTQQRTLNRLLQGVWQEKLAGSVRQNDRGSTAETTPAAPQTLPLPEQPEETPAAPPPQSLGVHVSHWAELTSEWRLNLPVMATAVCLVELADRTTYLL